MNPAPDFYDDEHALEMMAPHRLMEILFEETGLTQPDAKEPLIQLTLEGRKKWFTRNLVQCYLSELHHLLAKRDKLFLRSAQVVTVNGKPKLRLPGVPPGTGATGGAGDADTTTNAATEGAMGEGIPCDGVGYSAPGATDPPTDALTTTDDEDL